MTLILSFVSKEYAIQVSDRRLTWLGGKHNGRLEDDDTNKAVILGNRMGFSYTGLANIGSKKTDLWLAEVLAEAKCKIPSEAILAIQNKATEAFRRIYLPAEIKRHAFVGVGWALLSTDGPFKPAMCVISNALDEKGEWLSKAESEFKSTGVILADHGNFLLKGIGQPLSSKDTNWLERNLLKCVQRKTSAEPIIKTTFYENKESS